MATTTAIQCDKCGTKEHDDDAAGVPKGWTKVVVTDRVISGVELDLCEKHQHMPLSELSHLARELKARELKTGR